MHNFPQIVTNIQTTTTKLITHSDCAQTSFLNRIQLFAVYRNKLHVSITISNTETWCSLSWKHHTRYRSIHLSWEQIYLEGKSLSCHCFLISFLADNQSLGALGLYVLTSPQQHLVLGNSIYYANSLENWEYTRLKHIALQIVLVLLNTVNCLNTNHLRVWQESFM